MYAPQKIIILKIKNQTNKEKYPGHQIPHED
jgi:hypothetical protein